ncbi:MAG: amidohydrolase family protein [Candidatus Eremiobacterota bacterium]
MISVRLCLALWVILCAVQVARADVTGVDVHVHIEGSPGDGQRGAQAVQRLLKEMDRLGVEWAILMPPPQAPGQPPAASLESLEKLRALAPGRLAVAGGGETLNRMIHSYRPEQVTPEVRARFRAEADRLAGAGVAAYGEMAALHLSFHPGHVFEEASPDHPLFLELSDAAARHGIPIDLHMEAVPEEMPLPRGFSRSPRNPPTLHANVAGLERLLAHDRRAVIVWQHVGWDNTGCMTVPLLRRLLQGHPNLYLALRVEDRPGTLDGQPMPNRILDREGRIQADWSALLREFPERFVLGSDEFISAKERGRYPRSFSSTWSWLSQLPAEVASKIAGGNARRLYRLPR